MTYFILHKILMGWLALAVAQTVAGMVIRVEAPALPRSFEWLLMTDLLVAVTVGMIAVRADWTGWKLSAALALIPFAITFVNTVEGAVFLKRAGIPWRSLLPTVCLTYALVLPLWRYIFGGGDAAPVYYSPLKERSLASIAWRFVLSDFLYLFLYFAAGVVIWPYVKDFYATQSVPSAGTIFGLQLLLRGPVFVAVCLLLLRMIGGSRWKGAVSVGLAFTMLSGVAPLLMPNPYFPDAVRWVHFGEVVSSNFVFGALVGLIWGQSQASTVPQKTQKAAA